MGKEDENPLSELFGTNESSYGSSYQQHLFEQYKLYVEMADHISERRSTANNFFLSVNGFFLSIIGILPQFHITTSGSNLIWLLGISAAGILFCLAWFTIIRSYRKINEAKFTIIGAIEKRLPLAAFDAEWRYLNGDKIKEKRFGVFIKHYPLTIIESWVPVICIILYLGIMTGWSYFGYSSGPPG